MATMVSALRAAWMRATSLLRPGHFGLPGGRRLSTRAIWTLASVGGVFLVLVALAYQLLIAAPHPTRAATGSGNYCPSSSTSVSGCFSSSGTGLYLSGSVLFASKSAALTFTVTTSGTANKCVNVYAGTTPTGTPIATASKGGGQTTWSFPLTAAAADGTNSVIAAAFTSTNCKNGEVDMSLAAAYNVDATAPQVSGTTAPPPNGSGWNNGSAPNVTVTWLPADPTVNGVSSGVKSVAPPNIYTAEGRYTVTGTAQDNVGNTGTSQPVTVLYDKTAPTVAGSVPSPIYTAGDGTAWYSGPVLVSFSCTDPKLLDGSAGSGVVTCAGSNGGSGSTTVTQAGKTASVPASSTDLAGNVASYSYAGPNGKGINIDESGPTLSGAPGAPPSGTDPSHVAWYNSAPVPINWTCADTLSGVATCPATSNINGEGQGRTVSATATDNVGNSTTSTSLAVNIDLHPPITSLVAAPPDWSNTDVTLSFTATDALSGVATTYYSVDGGATTAGTSVVVHGEGSHTVKYWSKDYAGNTETANTATVKIDQTAPTISHAQTPLPNGNGWNNSSVTVTFTCADPTNASNGTSGSGVATCDGAAGTSGSSTASAEGQTPVTGTAVDNAGNTASDAATVKIDQTAPTISGRPDRDPDSNGWYNQPVVISFTCSDPVNASNGSAGSGISQNGCPNAVTLASDGIGQTASATVFDAAGNKGTTTTAPVKIDQAPPTITGAPVEQPNGNGWYHADVHVHWTCADALSGVATCPADSAVTGEGGNLGASASATDVAGNSATGTVSGVQIDRTAPTTTVAGMTPVTWTAGDGTLWYAGAVTVGLGASDNLSGIAATYYSVDSGPTQTGVTVQIAAPGHHTITFWSADNAGNVEDRTSPHNSVAFSIDTTAPSIAGSRTPSANGNGWNNTPITVTFTCSDGESGLASCTPDQTVATEGAGQSVTGTAVDNVGNTAQATVGSINVDITPPTISGTPVEQPTTDGWYNAPVHIQWACADALSGVAFCPATSQVSGEGHGLTATGAATDQAGNKATATSAPVNIDVTAPSLTGAATTAPSGTSGDGTQWYKGDVAIHWTCSDATLADGSPGSGVVACPADSTVGGEGADLTAQATAADHAGNTTTAYSQLVNIDRTAPNTVAAAPDGWNNTDVNISFNAFDALSGVKATYYTVDGGSQQTGTSLSLSAEGDHTITFWSVDNAGNSEAVKTIHVKIDKTAPNISHSQAPLPNDNGWNSGDVTVIFTCSDALSGVQSCDGATGDTGSTTVTTEGANQAVTGTAVDNAGNTATDPAHVSIDKTKPTISGAATTSPNGNGWYSGPVTVHFTCSDALSGIDTCTPDVTLGTDGANQHAGGTAVDAAGNSASISVSGISIDQTPPTISGAPTTSPNGNGWYSGDVTVHWTCADPLSGLDGSCPADTTVSGEGANLSASASVSDKAGNSASATVNNIHIDRSAPTTTWSAPTATYTTMGGDAWYGGPLTVTLTGTDALSGVAQTNYILDGHQHSGTSVAVSGDGLHTLTFWSVDNAGNVEDQTGSGHTITIRIDLQPPSIAGSRAPSANSFGWNNGPVTVSFTCSDPQPGSGLATCSPSSTISTEGQGQSVTGTAADNVGNTSSLAVSGISIDTTPPTLSGAPQVAPNGFGWYNVPVIIHWQADDTLSGIDPSTLPPDTGIFVDGAGQTVSATVRDQAGNATTAKSAPVNLDLTPPTLVGTVVTPASGTDALGTAWYNGDVTVKWSACDTLSGVDPATVPATSAPSGHCLTWQDVVTGEGSALSSDETAADKAGNPGAGGVDGMHIDTTAPTTTITAPDGWNKSDVAVAFAATDNLSGVQAVYYTVDGGSRQSGTSVTLTTEGIHTIQYWSVDYAGNTEVAKTAIVKIDKSAPSISHTLTPVPNGDGWNNGVVKVTFICADSLSGVASCTPAQTVTAEGANQPVSGTAVDSAGNTATDIATVSIDRTPPTIVAAPDRPANLNGWYNAPVTVTYTCGDALSGVKTCSSPVTLVEGANQSATGTVADLAGNSASATLSGINVDTTPPTISGAATTGPNGNGWYSGDVAVHWTCADPLSGVDGSCPADTTVSGEGANLSASASVSDKAGNSASATVNGIKIDRTAPVTTASVPAAVSNGWYNGSVTVTLVPTDTLSGVAATYYTVDGSSNQTGTSVTLNGDGTHKLQYWSVDKAGNVEQTETQIIKIDLVGPTITGAPTSSPNANNWYRTPVSIHFTCADAESGLASCTPDQTVTSDGKGQSVTGHAVDNVGNTSSATVGGINLDRTAPVVSVTLGGTSFTDGGVATPPDSPTVTFTHSVSAAYLLGGAPAPSCKATDATSGLAGSCAGTLSGGTSNGVGTFTYTATATDLAGNTTVVKLTFQVVYNFSGFLQPVNYTAHQTGPSSSTFKGGSTVPLKFQLRLANGTIVPAGSAPQFVDPVNAGPTSAAPVASAASAPVNTGNGGTFTWDPSGQQYIFTWNTASSQAGSWWRVGVKLDDGQVYLVYIALR